MNTGIKNRGLLFIIIGMIMLAVTAFFPERVQASAQVQTLSPSKSRVIKGGKWVKEGKNIKYRTKKNAYLKAAWYRIDGELYCFDAAGNVETKAFVYCGSSYYADSRGRVYINKWRKIKKKLYYYDAKGVMVRAKWKVINGKKYYFNRTGELVTSSWVGNTYVNKNGRIKHNTEVNGRKVDSSGNIKTLAESDRYIIVGASRIVDMSVATAGKNTVFIAKSGQGYSWLTSTAGPILKKYLKQHPNCKVLFQLGNNDMNHINKYIEYYKKLIKQYPNTEFYFIDATPGKRSAAANQQRKVFNEKMKQVFGIRCIGGYDYLWKTDYETVDSTHYTAKVSRQLYSYIIKKANALKLTGSMGISPTSKSPGTTKPTTPETTKPVTPETQPETTKPVTPETTPETTKPVTPETQPETTQPVTPETQPETTQPVIPETQPETTQPVTPETQLETTQTTAPETTKPTTSETTPTVLEPAQPETIQPTVQETIPSESAQS